MPNSIWIFGWDLRDEGMETCLQRIRDTAALDGISLAASYHAGRFLAPHNPRRKVIFLEDGTVYFRPDLHLYGRIQPIPNSLLSSGDLLDQARTACLSFGLRLHAWCSFCHNSALGSRYTDCTIENAFGDRYVHSLCPSHPDVQEFVLAVVEDLARNHDFEAIEIESLEYMQFRHGFHHEREEIELPEAIQLLLGLCFCQHCAARIGGTTDPVAFRAKVRERLEAFFQQAYPTPALVREDMIDWLGPGAADCFTKRSETLCDLHEKVAAVAHRHGKRVRRLFRPAGICWVYGLDPTTIPADEIVLLAYMPSSLEIGRAVDNFLPIIGPHRLVVGLRMGPSDVQSEEDLLQRIQLCLSKKVVGFNFFNYSLMRLSQLASIGHVLRFCDKGSTVQPA